MCGTDDASVQLGIPSNKIKQVRGMSVVLLLPQFLYFIVSQPKTFINNLEVGVHRLPRFLTLSGKTFWQIVVQNILVCQKI